MEYRTRNSLELCSPADSLEMIIDWSVSCLMHCRHVETCLLWGHPS